MKTYAMNAEAAPSSRVATRWSHVMRGSCDAFAVKTLSALAFGLIACAERP